MTDYDEAGTVTKTTLVFNRSLQVARACAFGGGDERLNCVLVTAEEAIWWLLIEEMHHAKLSWQARSRQRMDAWQVNYEWYLQQRGMEYADPLSHDLKEVSASRVVALTLAKWLAHRAPERAAAFHQAYRTSLAQGRHIMAKISRELAARIYLDEESSPASVLGTESVASASEAREE